MICTVYRSNKKTGAYVYCAETMAPDKLPEELQALLGTCVSVMTINLATRDKLAREDIAQVRLNLEGQGYHLQMPPKDLTQVTDYT